MLERTREKLESYHRNEPQLGGDGQMHVIDRVTRIAWEQSEAMAELHARIRPKLSLETGLAYGFSTLPILDAMERYEYGHHIAIDPIQMDYWNGVAFSAIRQLGFTERFTWDDRKSESVFVEMIQADRRIQFAFLDGNHAFEGLIADIYLLDQIMDIGGVLIVNDLWLAAARSVASYVTNNLPHYEKLPSIHKNIFVATKQSHDERRWDHFAPFDGHGRETKASRSIIRKLLRR